MTQHQYQLVVRDRICTPKLTTDETLTRLDCIYISPVFLWDRSFATLDVIIDDYQSHFYHFVDWTASVVSV